jgi:brefeldin A-inhibited guanine nucleotide-exchange protein
MEHMRDPYSAYTDLLSSAFDKIKKNLPKKYRDLRDKCSLAMEQSKIDKSLDGNKYFPICKMALDTNITKVVEVTLYYLQKLISHGFITGNCPDNCEYAEPPKLISTRHPRRLIDAIIESVCNCVYERDDNVQLQIIKTLLTAVTSFSCEVHDRSLLEAFRACYHIHITSKNLVNQTTAKATLTQMLHFVFQRMESTIINTGDDMLKAILSGVLRTLVDDVCIYAARTETMQNPPLRTVPLELNPDDHSYDALPVVDIKNEKEIPAGKFGWCTVCRNTADLYCSDTRDPVCSLKCQQANLKNIEAAEKSLVSEEDNDYLHDATVLFRSICKLSLKELSNASAVYTMKSKILSLELILAIVDNPGPVFISRKAFIDIIRHNLCESLLKNTVSSEKTIFTLSLSIFVALVNYLKDILKTEIGIFLEQIFIKILQSDHSGYHHKLLVLEVFYRITQNPKTTIEFFLNYDCDVEENDILTRMIDILGKIAQKKYRNESVLPPNQEHTLRLTSLETLANIVTAQVAWLEKESAFAKKQETTTEDQEDSSSESSSLDMASPFDRFEKTKQLKIYLSRAVAKFNFKPSVGIKFLAECGYLNPESPQEIAAFLKSTEGIDKTVFGDFLGEDKELNLKVLHEFVDMHDFSGLNLVDALRMFLAEFRLPGEGQKIDRIMEKFGEKYFKDNPNIFISADTAYVLSYSVIMLQTITHNPSIKEKMTVEQFITNNRGIDNGKDLDSNYLTEIYNSVKLQAFTLTDDQELKNKLDLAKQAKRQDMFTAESEMIVARSQELFKKSRKSGIFYTANDVEHIRTMFEAIWYPLLASFSIVLEESEDPKCWRLSLQGFVACIKIACRFGMMIELESFISALAKFTSLIYTHNEINEKNIECVKALLQVAKLEANYLRKSWLHVLKCLSRLDYLHLVRCQNYDNSHTSEADLANSDNLLAHISTNELDTIFSMSIHLDNEAVIDFVTKLVEVSREELWCDKPRTFSLQALVTVADFNMNRMRFVWSKLWACLKDHFSQAGLHPDPVVAMFALDSLKQLASKFLQKEELDNYHFQHNFLYPFEVIIRNSTCVEVKEMVVACMANFIFTISKHLKSGWHSIFEILSLGSKDEYTGIQSHIFIALEKILNQDTHIVPEFFQQILECLSNLAANNTENLSLKSIECMEQLSVYLYKSTVEGHFWFPLLTNLAERFMDSREHVQSRAVDTLFKILHNSSDKFSPEQWKMIYSGVIKPVFDDVQFGGADQNWIKITGHNALTKLVSLIEAHYNHLYFLIADFISLLQTCILCDNEVLARVAILSLRHLGVNVGKFFDEDTWSNYCKSFAALINSTIPHSLLEECVDGILPFNSEETVSKCVVQLHLVGACKEVFEAHISKIRHEDVIFVLKQLKDSYFFAKEFNGKIEHRFKLWKAGFLKDMPTMPGLLKQERETIACYLSFVFKIHAAGAPVGEGMYEVCKFALRDFITKERIKEEGQTIEASERERELGSISPVISGVLIPGLASSVKSAVQALREELADLIMCDSVEIRSAARGVLFKALELI